MSETNASSPQPGSSAPEPGRLQRRRRARRWVALAVSHIVVAAVVGGIVYGTTQDDGARSGTFYANQSVLLTNLHAQGEYYLLGKSPWFAMTVVVPGATYSDMKNATIDVSITAEVGCVAFGTQTKSFAWTGPSEYLENAQSSYVRWDFSGAATNVCLGSWYRVTARVRNASGVSSNWTERTYVSPTLYT